MAELLLFHHAQGQTPGFLGFAQRLRDAGHVVHAPDLYEGATYPDVESGVTHAKSIGFPEILGRGLRSAEGLPEYLVYAGFSMGVMSAQLLAQTRPGAKGALLMHACLPPEEFGAPWPDALPAQIHAMANDPWMEEDFEAARALAASAPNVELFVYPGRGHLFAEAGGADYDEASATQLFARVLDFLDAVGD